MDPVQEQLDAYNARDLERFLACYHPDAVVEDSAGGGSWTARRRGGRRMGRCSRTARRSARRCRRASAPESSSSTGAVLWELP
jgi:ketosteroid isomerase-like protein